MAENDEYSDVIFDPNVDIEDYNSESSFEEDEEQNLYPFITASSSGRESGLDNEFDILEPIGKGGFGDVMKARNKLDKRLYAIKKIPLNLESKKLNKKILREVKVLSRLNHTYVVRYYNAWTEKSKDSESCDDQEESEESLNETVDVEVMSGEFMSRINSPEQDTDVVDEATSTEKEFVKKNEKIERIHLYIQMEYCEKSTLRDCIDNNLFLDTDKRWKLFREILEGLAHIHAQGIIHRDLKPVNIFMDSNDNVKIGDFGLATSDSLLKKNIGEEGIFVASDGEPRYDSLEDGYLSGQIGTELYASPEIMTERTKYEYNQKVDIYSLGVIFFEMCCKPFETGMEKTKVIGDLRSEDIKLPDDFNQPENESEALILRWLLSHDPNQRPNATELLDSDHIPRQNELTRVISSITSGPQSRSYRQIIDELFSQTVSLAGAHAYDRNIYKAGFSVKTSLLQSLVSDRLIRVFRRHGAVQMSTPLLMPQQQLYENFRSYPLLMDHSGKLVGLPYDLRVPFARYISNANIKNVKRYCIEKVYRRQKVGGFHPQERTDCAFDIVTSDSKSLHPDAEVLVVMQDIINEFPPLKRSGYEITLKHTSIQQAVLLHFGIPEEKHILVVVALAREQIDSKSADTLANSNQEEESMSALRNFLRQRGSFTDVWSKLKEIFQTAGQAGTLAMEGLREIRSVITNAKILGVTLPIFVQIGCIYRTDLFNGVTFEVTCSRHLKKSRSRKNVYLANGGRYDNLIQQFEQRQIIPAVPMARTSGVGINLAFEKIVSAMKKHSEHLAAYDILVCTVGENIMPYIEKKKMKLVQQLWNAGFKAELLHEASESEETLQEFCKANGISYLVVLLTEKLPTLKVYAIEKGKVPKEEEMDDSQLLTFLQQKLIQLPVCEQYSKTNSLTSIIRQNKISTSDSDNVQQSTSVESTVSWNIVFRLQSGCLRSKVKRKNEALIKEVVQKSFPWLKVDCIEVVALDLSFSETKVLTSCLEVDYYRDEFEASVKEVVKKLPAYKKCIQKVANHIGTLISGERFSCIVLYSINEARARLLTRSAI